MLKKQTNTLLFKDFEFTKIFGNKDQIYIEKNIKIKFELFIII